VTKFFFKANDDVLSHCRCEGAPAMSEGQLDCPWCGCGWLIACSQCRKSFTFAEVRETDIPLLELGRREAEARGLKDITDEEVADWAEGMADRLSHFEIGDIVVYLDGLYWRIDETDIAFNALVTPVGVQVLKRLGTYENRRICRNVDINKIQARLVLGKLENARDPVLAGHIHPLTDNGIATMRLR